MNTQVGEPRKRIKRAAPCPCGCGTDLSKQPGKRRIVCPAMWSEVPAYLRANLIGAMVSLADRRQAAGRVLQLAQEKAAGREDAKQLQLKL